VQTAQTLEIFHLHHRARVPFCREYSTRPGDLDMWRVEMRAFCVACVSLILICGAACGGGYSSPSTAPSPAPSPTPGVPSASVAIPAGASSLGRNAFMPDELDVAVGSTVTWTNTDATAHTSTSDVAGWDSGVVAPGGRFSVGFQTAGTFPYHCAIHPGMVGTVTVR